MKLKSKERLRGRHQLRQESAQNPLKSNEKATTVQRPLKIRCNESPARTQRIKIQIQIQIQIIKKINKKNRPLQKNRPVLARWISPTGLPSHRSKFGMTSKVFAKASAPRSLKP